MARQRAHTHPCQDCGTPVDCSGEWEQNHDGVPEVICREFHQHGGINSDYRCDDCDRAYWGATAEPFAQERR